MMASRNGKQQGEDEFGFLGEEFLLWLWFCSEKRGGLHEVGGDARVGIAIDRLIEFYDEESGVKVMVRGDAPTRAPEAREALRRGMRIARAGLVITVGDENAGLVLDGRSFELRSIKGEKPQGDNGEERDQNALAQLFGVADSIDRVYRRYLEERAAATFGDGLAKELREFGAAAPRRRAPLRVAAAGE